MKLCRRIVRFNRALRAEKREITKRRLAAAERHLKKERERFALFADQLEQPTAEERVDAMDESRLEWFIACRVAQANLWRRCRSGLLSLPADVRTEVLTRWNTSNIPAEPFFLVDLVTNFTRHVEERMAAGERWFVFRVEDHVTFQLWDPKKLPPTCCGGPFERISDAVKSELDRR